MMRRLVSLPTALLSSMSTLLLVAALGLASCPDPAGKATVSDKPRLQLKYEMAKRALKDIERAKSKGQNYYADCQAVKLLAAKELSGHSDPAVKRLISRLKNLCKTAAPY
jgi:hypothetical protein